MAFRKKVFHDAGMFDLALDVGTPANGGGDIEIFHRILCKGFTVVYEPAMLVWHHHRKEMKDLEKQIYNNGRGFGCYLLAGFLGKTVSRGAIIEFWMREWLYKWVLKNIFSKKPKFPRRLSFLELSGMLSSPMAFYRSKRRVKRLTHKNPVHNNFEG